MVWAMAASLGPVIGGAFAKNVSWRWCFYVNRKHPIFTSRTVKLKRCDYLVPISGAAFAIIALSLKLQTPKTPVLAGIRAIDWVGSLAIAGGIVMFLLGLQFGGTSHPWSSAIVIGLIAGGAVTLILFGLIEWNFAHHPIIPMHLFTRVTNLAAILIGFFHGVAFTEAAYFLPLYFQSVLGVEPLLSGVILLPFVLALSVTSAAAGIYLKVTGRYIGCIRLGLVLSVLGCGLFYDLPRSKTWSKIVLYQIIAGIGIGANFQPPLIVLQCNVSPQDNGTATASFSVVRSLASAVGVVIGSVAFANKMESQHTDLRNELGDYLADAFSGANAQANLFLVSTLNSSQRSYVRGAFLRSLQDVWIETVCFAAAGLIASLFIRNAKLDRTHTEVRTGLEGEEERHRIALEKRRKPKRSGTKSEGNIGITKSN